MSQSSDLGSSNRRLLTRGARRHRISRPSWRRPWASRKRRPVRNLAAASGCLCFSHIFTFFWPPSLKTMSEARVPGFIVSADLPRAAPPAAMSPQALISGALKAKQRNRTTVPVALRPTLWARQRVRFPYNTEYARWCPVTLKGQGSRILRINGKRQLS